jgi:hypothetical protein
MLGIRIVFDTGDGTGVTSKLWEMADLVKVLEDWEAAKEAA